MSVSKQDSEAWEAWCEKYRNAQVWVKMPTSKTWELKRTVQCANCPWKRSASPQDIPNGYSEEKHLELRKTIAADVPYEGDPVAHAKKVAEQFDRAFHVMACHEEQQAHCIGWLHNQLTVGNNLPLRVQMLSCTNGHSYRVVGEQHQTFDATLPCQREADDGHQ